jgi:hypothetical protein
MKEQDKAVSYVITTTEESTVISCEFPKKL